MGKYWKEIALLLAVIIAASIASRILSSGETLSDYAKENPSAAYGSSTESVNSSSDSSSPANDKQVGSVASDTSVTTNKSLATSDSSMDESKSATGNSNNSITSSTENDSDTISINDGDVLMDRTTYANGFYYEPIPEVIKEKITGISYPKSGAEISLDELRYCRVQYVNFNDEKKSGELISNKAIAKDVMEIFYELYNSDYQIEQIRLIDEYNGDDEASMEANNTSCFNYRVIAGSTKLSKHSQGLAIDINPLYNPCISYDDSGISTIEPSTATNYVDRTASFPYKIDESDLAYKLFIKHGFTWGGNWNSKKDYQHFQKEIE